VGDRRTVVWVSAGAASAVAAKLTPDAVLAYCETGSEHPDNERFLRDCEAWWGVPVIRLRSDEYADTWDVWERRKFLSGPTGAPCTGILKVSPRHAFQRVDDIHVFGYTADANDQARARRLAETFHELTIENPLIAAGLDKAACLALVASVGIRLPVMYSLGFGNNNCLPCPKATSPNYWSAIRLHFPQEFSRMADLSRRLGARLTRIADVRIFIDEIPADWPTLNPTAPACDFLCQIAAMDLAA